MDETQLNEFRNHLLSPYNVRIEAPHNVSLHLFSSEKGSLEVIENFNNEAVDIKITFIEKQKRKLKLGLPDLQNVQFEKKSQKEYMLHLKPRSLAAISDL